MNVAASNSTDCTNVIYLFQAADSLTNLRICFAQYIQQVADMCTRTWRYEHVSISLHPAEREELGYLFVAITNSFAKHMAFLVQVVSANTLVLNHTCKYNFYRSSLLLMVSYHIRESESIAGPGVQLPESRTIESLCQDNLRFMQ